MMTRTLLRWTRFRSFVQAKTKRGAFIGRCLLPLGVLESRQRQARRKQKEETSPSVEGQDRKTVTVIFKLLGEDESICGDLTLRYRFRKSSQSNKNTSGFAAQADTSSESEDAPLKAPNYLVVTVHKGTHLKAAGETADCCKLQACAAGPPDHRAAAPSPFLCRFRRHHSQPTQMEVECLVVLRRARTHMLW